MQLKEHLAQSLESWPLYRRLEYKGAEGITAVPEVLKLFCAVCNLETRWQTSLKKQGSTRGMEVIEKHKFGFCTKMYRCKNCGRCSVTYYFGWYDETSCSVFYKVGQYPQLEERVSQNLAKALDADDVKAYKNAVRLRNFNLGIAAVAYMRRVVENRMNDLLEILHEAARVHGASAELLARHEEVMKEKRFAVKIDYAGDLLPANLRPEGKPNPMAILHELASDGLHSKSDEECVDIFDACRQTFEYVFGTMRA